MEQCDPTMSLWSLRTVDILLPPNKNLKHISKFTASSAEQIITAQVATGRMVLLQVISACERGAWIRRHREVKEPSSSLKLAFGKLYLFTVII